MMQNNILEVERIKSDYENKAKEQTKVEKLKALDKKVKNPAIATAYILGIISTLILGVGMCFVLDALGNIMWLGIVIGILGIILMSITYPIYKSILKNRKAKYSNEILNLSNQILNEEN